MAPLPEPLPSEARERVVDLLTRHFANDAVTELELETRLAGVYAATTRPELDAVVADLPPLTAVTPAARGTPATAIAALFSGQERALTGTVPDELSVRARLGYVELDLTRATFAPGVTTIDVRALLGYVQIRLPPGVRVESTGRALFGFFALKGRGGGRQTSDAPIVRITGLAAFGFAEAITRPAPDR